MGKWEMVRLGEVCEIVSGTTPKSNIEEYWNGTQNWVTPAELREDTLEVFETHRKITELAIKESSLKPFPAGTVLLSSRAPIGKVAIARTEMYCNQGFKNLVCSERIINKYLYWFLKGKTDYLNLLGRGATFKEISKSIVQAIELPLPPLDEQKRIAKNLDLASEIVKGYKEQLAELDKLVKSVFYEMFGDPVTNEKGWNLKRICDVSENLDSLRRPITAQDRTFGDIPYYGASGIVDYINGYIFDERLLLISEDGANLLARVTPIAFSVYGKAWVNNHAHVLRFSNSSMQQYIKYYLNMVDISQYVTGSAQPKLNQAKLNSINIPIPKISLIVQFDKIVTAIEAQKAQVQQALTEAENLFNSLMQEYFA